MRSSSNIKTFFSILNNNSKRVFYEFSKTPHSNIFFKNKYGLIKNSDIKLFDNQQWHMNPLKYSQDIYQNQYYYPIILMCNNIGSICDFNSIKLNNQIYTPKLKDILNLFSFERDYL
jgi:disulfide oxidoreductase YuzD